jgi:hypothetical protein
MREIFTSGSVGRAPGNRCLYPELRDFLKPIKGSNLILTLAFDLQHKSRFLTINYHNFRNLIIQGIN